MYKRTYTYLYVRSRDPLYSYKQHTKIVHFYGH